MTAELNASGFSRVARWPASGNGNEFRSRNAPSELLGRRRRSHGVLFTDQYQSRHADRREPRRRVGPVAKRVEPGDDGSGALRGG